MRVSAIPISKLLQRYSRTESIYGSNWTSVFPEGKRIDVWRNTKKLKAVDEVKDYQIPFSFKEKINDVNWKQIKWQSCGQKLKIKLTGNLNSNINNKF